MNKSTMFQNIATENIHSGGTWTMALVMLYEKKKKVAGLDLGQLFGFNGRQLK